jgi:peptide deformylase
MEIVTVDSPRASILHRRAKPVGKITDGLKRLIEEMIVTMREASGVGLAAPQVGVDKRVFVAEVKQRIHVFIDPVVVKKEGEEVVDVEGCLSIPGTVAELPRAYLVEVKAKNRKGRGVKLRAEGLLARVIQHEIDHLDGILITDRAEPSAIHTIPPEGSSEVTRSSVGPL